MTVTSVAATTAGTHARHSCPGIRPDDPRLGDLNRYIAEVRERPGSLIAVLHRAQELFGFLPEQVLLHIARELQVPASEVYGVVTFYNFFSTRPVGKHSINVCMGTACYVKGGDRVLEALREELGIGIGEVTPDGLFSIEVCRCVGACSLAPVVTVGNEVHGQATPEEMRKLVAEIRRQEGADEKAGSDREPAAVGGDSR